ncbi:MAG: serine/threonine-protein kinase, partial [Acidobacteriota bacterium]
METRLRTGMTADRWRRVREALDEIFAEPPDRRGSRLHLLYEDDPSLGREVSSLLRAHGDAEDFLEPEPGRFGAVPWTPAAEPPRRIGGYRVLGPLGQGGMGAVYAAERDDDTYRQRVAIKLLRPGLGGPDLLRRFRSERQILANLRHPHIARLLDGGTTDDGQPYLVLEHVDGTPIDRYCRDRGLGVEERLGIFVQVCRAVHFAHQNLIVHRDLKPANILIEDDGGPKLLDFGIAKLLDTEAFPQTVLPTQPGATPMTPAYASPEQATGGVITTASDVYSLGVLLYELLTARRPRRPTAEVDATTRGEGPRIERPSTAVQSAAVRSAAGDAEEPRPLGEGKRLARRLRGDLDNIVLFALRREPERRYPSAEELARDIERHLQGLPVRARADTLAYRVGRFVLRNRLAVSAAVTAVAVLLALVVGLAQRTRELRIERDVARESSEFLVEMFALPDPHRARGERLPVRELLDRGAERVSTEWQGRPEVRASLMATMGRSLQNLGLYREAEPLLQEALAEQRRLGAAPAQLGALLRHMAELETSKGDLAAAERFGLQALELDRSTAKGSEEEVRDLVLLGRLEDLRADYARAEGYYQEALDLARGEGFDAVLPELLDRYALLLSKQARYAEADSLLEEALEINLRVEGERHPFTAIILNDRSLAAEGQGDYELALDWLRQAEALQLEIFEKPHPHLATTLHNLGGLLLRRGRYDEALPHLEQALQIRQSAYGGDHPRLASTLGRLGTLHGRLRDPKASEEYHRQALDMRLRLLGSDHPKTGESHDLLAQALVDLGRLDEAEAGYGEALRIARLSQGDRHPQVAAVLNNLADLAHRRDRYGDAEGRYREALGILT